mmetsp:Transcript_24203/g.47071  ORF Transcript_24203/g.47071 Transcript_24203/m.47071 type:complete len:109 (-) Transcript_24203:19-345(-)
MCHWGKKRLSPKRPCRLQRAFSKSVRAIVKPKFCVGKNGLAIAAHFREENRGGDGCMPKRWSFTSSMKVPTKNQKNMEQALANLRNSKGMLMEGEPCIGKFQHLRIAN